MKQRNPSILQSIIPIFVLLTLILCNVIFIPDDTLAGANQLSLLFASSVAVVIAVYNRVSWDEIMHEIVRTISSALPAIMILLMVGILSGSWMISGIIPTMIYYGLDILQPAYFLPACVVITAAVSVATGSSWSTVATIGVALIGIGAAMDFNEAYTAGAIISGAYFGDKVSPLSDTTNLASAVTNTDIFVHIRYMMQTTIPSIVLTLIGFTVITLMMDNKEASVYGVQQFQQSIASIYNVHWAFMLIPAITVYLIVRKIPAVPVLMIGSTLAIITAAFFQQDFIASLCSGDVNFKNMYEVLSRAMFGRTTPQTANVEVNSLLSTGGMAGMMNTVWLIVTAMIFGGIMEAGRFLERITGAILSRVKSRGGLVTSATGSALLFNITAGDQYMAIVVPGKMFNSAFNKAGLEGRLLSRTLEDSATATSVLIPWNTCGATQASVLGVATLTYLPFAFFCWLSPLLTLFVAWTGLGIKDKLSDKSKIKHIETESESI